MDDLLRKHGPWPVLVTGAFIGLGGLVLIAVLLGRWPVSPDNDWRSLFLLGLWLALTGLSLPLIWLLHRRFGRPDIGQNWRSFGVLLRQAVWVGIWAVLCAWLQMNRTLNLAMALLALVVLVLVEALLLTRREARDEP